MTIRERIENNLETDEIIIEMKDNLGTFNVRFKKLSTQDFDGFNRSMAEYGKIKSDADLLKKAGQLVGEKKAEFDKKDEEYNEYLYHLFEKQSFDNLTADFWRNGEEYAPGLIKVVLNKIIEESASQERYLADVKTFRGQ